MSSTEPARTDQTVSQGREAGTMRAHPQTRPSPAMNTPRQPADDAPDTQQILARATERLPAGADGRRHGWIAAIAVDHAWPKALGPL